MLLDKCEICGKPTNLVWDHCHKTNLFRGTLCSDCNFGLGNFKDNETYLTNAIMYLEKFKKSLEENI
jgi:hypothetical protein